MVIFPIHKKGDRRNAIITGASLSLTSLEKCMPKGSAKRYPEINRIYQTWKIVSAVQWRSQPKILGVAKYLILGEQQYI